MMRSGAFTLLSAGVLALVAVGPAAAQSFNPFGDLHSAGTTWRSQKPSSQPKPQSAAPSQPGSAFAPPAASPPGLAASQQQPQFPKHMQGGPRPSISPVGAPTVAFPNSYGAGNIVIDTKGRALYFILSSSQAIKYPISVGREGFQWSGVQKVSRKVAWPDWRPPAEMRKRQPNLPVEMTGGINNPLGAMAIYLGSTLYRIHGTNDASTIGQAASSGCFRMTNGQVMHLAQRVSVGATVHVLKGLPSSKKYASN